jgi:CheY-like chemotaxis protein
VRRILLVDDNEDLVNATALLLRFAGHEVMTARNGYEALQCAEEDCPQLVLLDIAMPGMDGFSVAQKLRQMHSMKEILIIALTGYGLPSDRARCKAAGFDLHLLKPFTAAELFELVQCESDEAQGSPIPKDSRALRQL